MSEEYLVSRRYDWDDVSPTVGVVEALSDAADADPATVTALAETVDPDSLNELCTSASTKRPVTVSFLHAGYEVLLRSDGFVGVDSA